jgi:hypothetical protein
MMASPSISVIAAFHELVALDDSVMRDTVTGDH